MDSFIVTIPATGWHLQRLILIILKSPLQFLSTFVANTLTHHPLNVLFSADFPVLQFNITIANIFLSICSLQIGRFGIEECSE